MKSSPNLADPLRFGPLSALPIQTTPQANPDKAGRIFFAEARFIG
ncbi:hypothetical protein [Sphingomonas sp. KC8]|nr:hypothetical protein [Sphingomonas sp. KC8]